MDVESIENLLIYSGRVYDVGYGDDKIESEWGWRMEIEEFLVRKIKLGEPYTYKNKQIEKQDKEN